MTTKERLHQLVDELPDGEILEAERLLESLTRDGGDHNAPPRRPSRDTLSLALGIGATDGPAPTDAVIEDWLEEHRRERYGP